MNTTDEQYMRKALQLAEQALEEGEVPVGAIVVSGTRTIGKGYNQVEKLNDATAHAEMIAVTAAFSYLGAKYLPDCTLYVTLEPCVMCGGAMNWAQVQRLVYGASDEQRGYNRFQGILHPKTSVTPGVLESESQALLQEFFQRIRKK
jgi:tRNA(adenine34) deaminase